ncbi:MAG TPA: hypothetical protein VHA56_12890 [Mucilaginibacter sp.]|nr:hypothetical protein [Mucilaginibacter sp.]
MYITTIAFQELYKEFLKAVRLKDLSGDDMVESLKNEESTWGFNRKNTQTSFMELIFGSNLSKTYFFDKRYREKTTKQHCYIAADILIAALQHINHVALDLDKIININRLRKIEGNKPEHKAKILWQFFLEKNVPDEFNQNKTNVYVYDLRKNEIIIEAMTRKFQKSLSQSMSKNIDKNFEEDKKKISQTIESFYSNLADPRNIETAWQFITETTRQERWDNEIANFKKGYKSTMSIEQLHIWNIQIVGGTATCKVFYEDDTRVQNSAELANLHLINMENIQQLAAQLEQIRKKAEKAQIPGFDEIEIQKFFDPTVSEYLWIKLKVEPSEINKVFPKPDRVNVPRLMFISLLKDNDDWFIESFDGLNAYTIN